MKILAEISLGELIDKVTILEIKSTQLVSKSALQNVAKEKAELEARLDPILNENPKLASLKADLKQINEALWRIENDIRAKESKKDFGSDFIQLARSVYFENDKRSALKRQINEAGGSSIIEEKAYPPY